MNLMLNTLDSLKSHRTFSYRLPEISGDDVAEANRLALAAPSLSFPVLDGQVSFYPRHGHQDAETASWEEIELLIGEEQFCLLFETSMLATLLAASKSPLDMDCLGAVAAALVLEHVLSETLDQLEAELGLGISILSCARNRELRSDGRAIAFRVRSDHLSNPSAALLVAVSSSGQRWLVDLICSRLAHPPETRLPDITFPATLNSPIFEMDVAEMRALGIGDLVLLDKRWAGLGSAEFRVADRRWGKVQLCDDTLYLDDLPDYGATSNREAKDMSMTTDETIKLDDLPITLSLEIDRKDVSLQELSGLVAGSVLPFSSTEPEKVRLMANGRFFAEGELMKIDQQIGIRLTRLK